MQSWRNRTLLVGLLMLAAASLAEIGPRLVAEIEGSGTRTDPNPSSETDTGDTAAAPLAAPTPDVAHDDDATRSAPALESLPPSEAIAFAGDAPRPAPFLVTRDEMQLLADLVVDAAAAPPPFAAAAPTQVPEPTLLATTAGWNPVYATALPEDARIFVLDRVGRIMILNPEGTFESDPFLDIRTQVATTGEGGLLGMAFAPDHATSGEFYVNYTARGDFRSKVSRFKLLSGDPNLGDPNSEQIILEVDQPQFNHNGGTIAFSPLDDDNLYVGLGDGGGGGGLGFEEGQDAETLLGSMLRIDVSDGNPGYAIPEDNPYFQNDDGIREEIWSIGWRNPFRWSFDSETGDMWIGEVGAGTAEEINFEPANADGRNYEWSNREGDGAGPNDGDPFGPGTRQGPEIVHLHADGACSITGGSVYRGPLDDFQGVYFYADYCQGTVWTYERGDASPDDITDEFGDATNEIVAITEDGFGALLVVLLGGEIYRMGPTGGQCDNDIDDDGDGRVDDEDPGCGDPYDPDDPSELNPAIACDDGIDNDGDGDVDYRVDEDGSPTGESDGNCSGPDDALEEPLGTECDNGVDDDNDGDVDFPDDLGCANEDDASELDPNIQCDDGVDNDGDGNVDYPNDGNCSNSEDISEGGSGGDDSGGGCGLGFELALLVPLIRWARRRRAA